MSLPSLYATEGPYLRLVRARAGRYVATRIPLTRVCPRALSLVWSAGDSFWGATSSPPSQSWSSTVSRTFGKERGRETRHARQHASLPETLSACRRGLHNCALCAHAQVAMLPRASPLTRLPPRLLSCVVRRSLHLSSNELGDELVALPAEVFNGLSKLK